MADEKKYIKKIQLSNGNIYWLYDAGAPRAEELNNYLPLSGGTITGFLEVDEKLKAGSLQVVSIEYLSNSTDNVLVQDADGNIKKRSVDNLLADIGGCSYSMDEATCTLSLQIGKQN